MVQNLCMEGVLGAEEAELAKFLVEHAGQVWGGGSMSGGGCGAGNVCGGVWGWKGSGALGEGLQPERVQGVSA